MSRSKQVLAPGFTTLEVLCATTLSALLMVAVMGLVAGLSRHERILREKAPLADWQRRLARQLELDIARSWQLDLLPDGFQLTGPLGGRATWKEARVSYRLVDSPVGKLVVREMAWDLERSAKSQTEIVLSGVAGIELCDAAETPAWQPGHPLMQSTLRPGPIPDRLRVLFYGHDGRPLLDQFCHVY